jgi:hypothetical protein
LQATQEQDRAILVRESGEFFVERPLEFAYREFGERARRRAWRQPAFAPGSPPDRGLQLQRGVQRRLVKPADDRLTPTNVRCLLGQKQEHRLGGIFGVVEIAEHTAAEVEDHGAVTAHQCFKGVFVPSLGESAQQLPIRGRLSMAARHEGA